MLPHRHLRALNLVLQNRSQQRGMRCDFALGVGVIEFRVEDELSRSCLKSAQMIEEQGMRAGRADCPVERHICFDKSGDLILIDARPHMLEGAANAFALKASNTPFRQRQLDGKGFENSAQAKNLARSVG